MFSLSTGALALTALLSGSTHAASALTSTSRSASPPAQLFDASIATKVLATFHALPNPVLYPQYTDTLLGKWQFFAPDTWTSGFFPATGYEMHTRQQLCGPAATDGGQTGAATTEGGQMTDWLQLGRSASTGLLGLDANHGIGHDVGFISFPFVEELAIEPNNQTAINAINRFAAMLAARFNPVVGCTRSWDTADATDFQVIIDNMMNLEVLFHSAALTGNATLRAIATSHADTTMKNHIRADGSTWHVIEYNSTTGNVIKKRTAQGYADNSTWARGQAWGIYGFANMHRLTNDDNYLATSRRLATYFLKNMPSDGIVPWDFNAPLTPAPRPADSSAATIAVNGLLLLSQQETDRAAKQQWIDAAIGILNNITKLAWNPSWQSLLSNGTVNWPANNLLTGIVYGDYYFIKAGNELVKMGLASCGNSSRDDGLSAGANADSAQNQSQASSGRRGAAPFKFWQ